MKIKLFYHILLENHWYSIVKEHQRILKSSKLHDRIQDYHINIAIPNDITGKKKSKLLDFFYLHFVDNLEEDGFFYNKKLSITQSNKDEYEFPTLEIAISESKSDSFIGLYIHTKGSSNPCYEKDWMLYTMNIGILENFEDHIIAIEKENYDMSGCNLLYSNPHFSEAFINKWKKSSLSDRKNIYKDILNIPKTPWFIPTPYFMGHIFNIYCEYKWFYSGNFFYFNSDFFKSIDLSKIDKKNRYWAESIYGLMYNPKMNSNGYSGYPFYKKKSDNMGHFE